MLPNSRSLFGPQRWGQRQFRQVMWHPASLFQVLVRRFPSANCQAQIGQTRLRFKAWGQRLTLATSLSFLYFSNPAQAAEQVLLQFTDRQITVSITELQTYVETGEGSDSLKDFIAKIPSEEGFERQLFADKLPLRFAGRENQPISRNMQFVLYQINQLIGDASGRENYEALRHALLEASQTNEFTILGLLTAYPEETVRVELRELEQIYGSVNLFLERLQPLVQSEQFIEDWLCECETANAAMVTSQEGPESPCDAQALGTARSESQAAQIQDAALQLIALDWLQHTVNSASAMEMSTIDRSRMANPVFSVAGPTLVAADLALLSHPFVLSSTGTAAALEAQPTPASSSASASVAVPPNAVAQDKQVVITFGPLGRSLKIAELTHFAETGEASRKLRSLLGLANIDPEIFRAGLNRQVKANGRLVDRVLHNLLGEYVLFQVGGILHSKSGRADIPALRSTLVLSTLDDGLISPIEFLQRYPLQSLYVDGVALLRLEHVTRRTLDQDFGQITEHIGDWLEGMQRSLAAEVCDCEAMQAQLSPETSR